MSIFMSGLRACVGECFHSSTHRICIQIYAHSRTTILTWGEKMHSIRPNSSNGLIFIAQISLSDVLRICNITIETGQVQICYFFKHRLSIVQMLNGIGWVEDSDFWMHFMIILHRMKYFKCKNQQRRGILDLEAKSKV